MGAVEISKFLSYLAKERNISASIQNQALSALPFLYSEVLDKPIDWIDDVERAKKPQRLSVALTKEEAKAALNHLRGETRIMGNLLYGSGMRLMKAVRLRVKELDFNEKQIIVREGKGNKDRVTVLPKRIIVPTQQHFERVNAIDETDIREAYGKVYLPFALARKYPNANREWCGQYIFPAQKRSVDHRSGQVQRDHISETVLQRAVKSAIKKAGINRPASCHTLRHSFATRLLENGYRY